jgi:hypothetical protein
VAEKAIESLSSPLSLGGMKDVSFPAGQSVINRKLPKEKTTNNSQ